jgi:hypothetical protein
VRAGHSEQTDVLSLGSIVGGSTSTNRAWRDEIARLTKDVISSRTGLVSTVHLNVVFHVAGNIIQPEFEGVRTGTYRKSDHLLMVQVALFEPAPSDPRRHLLASLHQAVEAAERWSAGRRIAFQAQPLLEIIERIERS